MQVGKARYCMIVNLHKLLSPRLLTTYGIDVGLGKTWVNLSLFLLLTDSILKFRRSALSDSRVPWANTTVSALFSIHLLLYYSASRPVY